MHNSWADGFGVEVPSDIAARLAPLQRYRSVLPADEYGPVSLWHPACTTHRNYNLSCSQYEELLAIAGYVCLRCRKPAPLLVIDHDHSVGWWGVRGLLCSWCNNHLGRVDAGRSPVDELTAAFLAKTYTGRRPADLAPVKSLRNLLWTRYWKDHDAAAREAGWVFDLVDLRKAAAVRASRAFLAWRRAWEQRPEVARLLDLMSQEAVARSAATASTAPQYDRKESPCS